MEGSNDDPRRRCGARSCRVDRELLCRSAAARNVAPILESGEHDGNWVLVMPRAEVGLCELIARGTCTRARARAGSPHRHRHRTH